MERHGWQLVFHDCIAAQLQELNTAVEKANPDESSDNKRHAKVKLFRLLSRLILEVIPCDPGREEYCQRITLGPEHQHWLRARLGRRSDLYFRYDAKLRIILFGWLSEERGPQTSGCTLPSQRRLTRRSSKALRRETEESR